MNDQSARILRSDVFRQIIAAFIHDRRDTKLKGLDAGAAAAAAGKYDYHTWLADAARRVEQIQAVTHVVKATHPDARGSSLYIDPQTLPSRSEVGSHVLGQHYETDIVGNAAALDVYKFLKLQVEGRRLLDWLEADDGDLLAALHEDPGTARQFAAAFKGLTRAADTLVSHGLAKQVYWCVFGEPADDSGYHLLQPLFSSSLAHAVHQEINDARFGEANKEARQAWRDKKAHDGIYRDYRNLVARKLGGTKPQNISQLNSERGGINYLLASLPPQVNQDRPRQFLRIDSVLHRFRYYEGVSEMLNALLALLTSNPEPNLATRIKRERIERALGQSLAAFGMASRELFQPGWSRDADCHLPLCERLWLDPDRTELPLREEESVRQEDEDFIAAFERKDWPDEVAHRFGNWLNGILLQQKLPVGDAEHAHWARQALIDAEWPAPMQRRARPSGVEVAHG